VYCTKREGLKTRLCVGKRRCTFQGLILSQYTSNLQMTSSSKDVAPCWPQGKDFNDLVPRFPFPPTPGLAHHPIQGTTLPRVPMQARTPQVPPVHPGMPLVTAMLLVDKVHAYHMVSHNSQFTHRLRPNRTQAINAHDADVAMY
jgi:hypothetical protein